MSPALRVPSRRSFMEFAREGELPQAGGRSPSLQTRRRQLLISKFCFDLFFFFLIFMFEPISSAIDAKS